MYNEYTEVMFMEQKRVAIYCRVAGNGNAELKQIALEHQRQNLEHYAAQKGLAVVNCYEDVGYNGLTDDRPGLQQLMADAAAGSFDTVLVYKTDRLYRQPQNHRSLPFSLVSIFDVRDELER